MGNAASASREGKEEADRREAVAALSGKLVEQGREALSRDLFKPVIPEGGQEMAAQEPFGLGGRPLLGGGKVRGFKKRQRMLEAQRGGFVLIEGFGSSELAAFLTGVGKFDDPYPAKRHPHAGCYASRQMRGRSCSETLALSC